MEFDEALERLFTHRKLENNNTKKTYFYTAKQCDKLSDEEPFWEFSEEKIKEKLDKLERPLRTKYAMLNMFIMFRQMNEKPNKTLIPIRLKLKDQIDKKTKDDLPHLDIPGYETYFKGVDECEETHPQKYIINYLVHDFGFRNLDMFMKIVKLGRGQRLPKNDDTNYMIIQSRDILMEVRNYKTKATYGTKKIRINKKEHPKLVRAINRYYDLGFRDVLSTKHKEPIARTSLHSHIRNLTQGYGAGAVFKSVIQHLRLNGKLNRISEISKTRGTALQTLVDNYNVEGGSESE